MNEVGIYIHIPFCVKKCNYCDFPSFSGLEEEYHAYSEAVGKEIEIISREYGPLSADTVFFGGGTPSLLPSRDIRFIMETLSEKIHIKKNTEITLEANPGTFTTEKVKTYKELGFNRISIGLQAAQDRLLQLMGRIHTADMFIKSIDLLRNAGYDNLNADIMFGVPGQSITDWLETVGLVLQSGVSHVSAYSLKIEMNTPWFELNENGKLPYVDDSLERAMYYQVIERLADAGFHQYEISNFSKPGYESRHNLKYWTGKPYLGIGAAAHSFVHDERLANVKHPVEYIQRMQASISPQIQRDIIGFEERLSERFILGLRLTDGVSMKQLEKEFSREAVEKYRQTITLIEKKNLVCFKGDMLQLTKSGMDYANLVWMEFL